MILWNTEAGDHIGIMVRTFGGHDESLTALTFSSDGKWLATGARDATIQVDEPSLDEETRTAVRIAGGEDNRCSDCEGLGSTHTLEHQRGRVVNVSVSSTTMNDDHSSCSILHLVPCRRDIQIEAFTVFLWTEDTHANGRGISTDMGF